MKIRIAICIFALLLSGCGGERPSGTAPRPRRPGIGKKKEPGEAEGVLRELKHAIRITTSDYYDSYPSWSPDGKRIAYASYREGAQNIWVIEINTSEGEMAPVGEPIQVTTGKLMDENPSWSPDGETIIFSSNRTGKPSLCIVKLSDNEVVILEQEGIHPRWSRQSDKIAFVDMNNIWTMELNNEKSRRWLTPSGYNEFPCWSGDGSKLIFSSSGNLLSINEDGSMPMPLTSSGWNNQPDWSDERDEIVLVSNRGEHYDLWKMKSDGTSTTQLTDGPGQESSPTWSPDGKWIAFQANYEGSFDIWAIPVEQKLYSGGAEGS